MSLPADFNDPSEYFVSSVAFLKKYAWIYQNSNTTFLRSGVLEKFPNEFKEYFLTISNDELNEFPFLHFKERNVIKCKELQDFRTTLKSLIPESAFKDSLHHDTCVCPNKNLRKMNLKKQHEICKLAGIITELCKDTNLLIDFGSGLGYLSEIVYNFNNNILILGLESDLERVQAAEKRRQQYMPTASNRIIYKQQFINENSLPIIIENAEELCKLNRIENPEMAVIGLHACADLTITAMRLFFKMSSTLKRLIIMPCCYHKMEICTDGTFQNFPLSLAMKNVIATDPYHSNYINRPFLRLACQQTLARWQNTSLEEHKFHGIEMFKRGIAEAIINNDTEYVVKRKGVLQKNKMECLSINFAALTQDYELKSKVTSEMLPWNSEHKKTFEDIRNKYPRGYELAEGLTCLQTTMQKLCENIVLYDRLCYMQEYASTHGLDLNVRYQKLLNEKLSPRCYVLIAEKL